MPSPVPLWPSRTGAGAHAAPPPPARRLGLAESRTRRGAREGRQRFQQRRLAGTVRSDDDGTAPLRATGRCCAALERPQHGAEAVRLTAACVRLKSASPCAAPVHHHSRCCREQGSEHATAVLRRDRQRASGRPQQRSSTTRPTERSARSVVDHRAPGAGRPGRQSDQQSARRRRVPRHTPQRGGMAPSGNPRLRAVARRARAVEPAREPGPATGRRAAAAITARRATDQSGAAEHEALQRRRMSRAMVMRSWRGPAPRRRSRLEQQRRVCARARQRRVSSTAATAPTKAAPVSPDAHHH